MRASESDRAVICPASLVRPKTGVRSRKADVTASWGTMVHKWKETDDYSTGTTSQRKTFTKKLAASAIDREKLWPADTGGTHECTFSINLETLQLRQWSPTRSKFSSDHWKRRHPRHSYLTGSIDWLSTVVRGGTDSLPWVDDLKTGTWPVSPRTSKQLRSYALVPWILADCDTDVWVSITQWPKYKLSCKPKRSWHKLTSADLARHYAKLKWAVSNTDTAVPSKDGCMFCMCKPDCVEFQESDYN
jgi:hypothetical protein